MMEIALEQEDRVKQFDMLERLSKYLYPIRKAVEHSTDEIKGFKIVVEDYTKSE